MRVALGQCLRRIFFCAALAGLTMQQGCFAPVAERCPDCTELSLRGLRRLPQLPPSTERLFILIPGLLGYGWEWNPAQIALAAHPEVTSVVYSWQPWLSVTRSGERLGDILRRVDRLLPSQVREVTVIAHSAAGMIALEAAGHVGHGGRPLQRPLRIVTIGAPLAGMGLYPDPPDLRNTPLAMVVGGRFTHWPRPAPGVHIEVFPTGPDDPVMRPVWNHDPADVRVLPPGARVTRLPTGLGHNNALGWLLDYLLTGTTSQTAAQP